jgi:transcriptional regulator with XRE-family HTH domain
MDIDSYIIGENFIEARESLGMSRAAVAQKLCCSALQIQQIEEGGKSSFYTQSQKLNTAKKLALFLKLNPESAFVGSIPSFKNHHLGFDSDEKETIQTQSSLISMGLSGIGLCLLGFVLYGVYESISPSFNLYAKNTIQQNELLLSKDSDSQLKSMDSLPLNSSVSSTDGMTNDPCLLTPQNVSSFTPSRANFVGNFVVFLSKTEQKICVIDGKGDKHPLTVIPGQKNLVNGVGPFTIVGSNLSQIETFYQGWKVTNLSPESNSVYLKEAPVQLRAEVVKPVVVNQNSDTSVSESNVNVIQSVAKSDSVSTIQNISSSSADKNETAE